MTGLLTRSTIVVVTWRGKDHVSACLAAVAAQTRPHRLLVIDNASDDGTASVLAEHPSAPPVLRLPANVGYAGALAAAPVDTEFTAWLNDDAEPAPDWLARLEDALDQRQDAAAAGSRMVGVDGSVISLGVGLTRDGYGVDLVAPDEPAFGFCGGAVLLRTAVLRDVGGVPARFFCYYEDTDTAWRLRLAGHTIVSVPEAEVTHRHGASTRPGSRQFHLWNERNRLAMLVRCAPAGVAAREVARFAAVTAMLPIRRAAMTARRLAGVFGRAATRTDPAPAQPAATATRTRREVTATRTGPETVRLEAEVARPDKDESWPERQDTEAARPEAGAGQPVDNPPPAEQGNVDNPPFAEPHRRSSPVAWIRGPEASETQPQADAACSGAAEPGAAGHRSAETPWNFRVGLRLQVLREVAGALPVTLRERRTISRVTNVPRSMVWRRARSVNSAG